MGCMLKHVVRQVIVSLWWVLPDKVVITLFRLVCLEVPQVSRMQQVLRVFMGALVMPYLRSLHILVSMQAILKVTCA